MEIKSRPVWESLKFYLTSLKNLPVSESLMLDGDKGFCVSTGSSWDSWVYYPERLKDSDTVKEILKFFNSRRIAFLFPVYDADNGSEKICKDCGLFFRENFTAMSFVPKTSPETDPEMKFKHVTSPEMSKEWAETSWRGFGGLGDVGESYYRFVDALSDDRKNLSLYIAEHNGKNSGVFLLTHYEKYAGVFFFATVPEMRRKGIARAMMNEICRLSANKKIVLLSMEGGLLFYKNFGFEELSTIPIYSNEIRS